MAAAGSSMPCFTASSIAACTLEYMIALRRMIPSRDRHRQLHAYGFGSPIS
jgi:hypothetical protein